MSIQRSSRSRLSSLHGLLAFLLLGFAPLTVCGGTEVLGWIPSDTRVLIEVDPQEAERQPGASAALGLDAFLDRLAARHLPATERQRQILAYIPEGVAASPVAFTVGTSRLGRAVERVRGEKLESVGGKSLYSVRGARGWSIALIEADCVLEGPQQTVRTLLDHAARQLPSLADVPAARPQRRLLALAPGPATAISLLYFVPEGGKGVYAALQDLDRTLGTDMSAGVASYQSALRILGSTLGARLDVSQQRDELATTLRLVMPSAAAANLASISLQVGKDMARMVSDSAVEAGDMAAADARVLTDALETLQARAEEDWVHVRVRVADVLGAQGAR